MPSLSHKYEVISDLVQPNRRKIFFNCMFSCYVLTYQAIVKWQITTSYHDTTGIGT